MHRDYLVFYSFLIPGDWLKSKSGSCTSREKIFNMIQDCPRKHFNAQKS